MIAVEKLVKSFGSIRALAGVSLSPPAGKITVVAGADGAGKSTLFRIMVGLLRQDEGRILLGGQEVSGNLSVVTRITGYMPEKFSLYPDLSVVENLDFFADIHQVPKPRREEMKKELLARMGLAPFGQRRAGALSGGMKQKLSLSTLLLSSPQLLILDEPTTGVDPLSRFEFFGIIQDLQRQGKTILLSTPYLDEAEKGDFVVFLKNGRVLLQESIARLRRDFPGRLYRILPQQNVLEALAETRQNSAVGGYVYVRGRYLKYLPARSENVAALFPVAEIVEEIPSLEDIYLYYERDWSKAGDER